jgi:hypothetical protein
MLNHLVLASVFSLSTIFIASIARAESDKTFSLNQSKLETLELDISQANFGIFGQSIDYCQQNQDPQLDSKISSEDTRLASSVISSQIDILQIETRIDRSLLEDFLDADQLAEICEKDSETEIKTSSPNQQQLLRPFYTSPYDPFWFRSVHRWPYDSHLFPYFSPFPPNERIIRRIYIQPRRRQHLLIPRQQHRRFNYRRRNPNVVNESERRQRWQQRRQQQGNQRREIWQQRRQQQGIERRRR